MKPYLPFLFLNFLYFFPSLQAQVRIEKNTIPWPYDTVSVFEHNTASPTPDSTLDHVIIYFTNTNGGLSREFVLTDSLGTDTLSKRILFLDGMDRDTLDLRYKYFNGSPALQSELRKSYHASGEFDSVSVISYASTSPYGLSNRSVIYFDSTGRLTESYIYLWKNNALTLTSYSINQYQDSLLISRSFYRDFNILTSPILSQKSFNFFDSQGTQIYSTLRIRPHPDSSLLVTDSTTYTYDSQAREIRSEKYTSNRINPLKLFNRDTTEYFTGINDYLNTEFSFDNGQLSPNRRLRYLDSDSLFYYQTELWEDTCSCWWENFKDSSLIDRFGRREESFTWSMTTPTDTAFFHNQRYLYYGNQPIRKYYLDDYNALASHTKKSYLYSIRDSILSSNLKPLIFSLKLYPNPSTREVSLEYPSGQPGSLRIYEVDGSLVFQEELTGDGLWTRDLSHLPAGLYAVEVLQGNKRGATSLLILR